MVTTPKKSLAYKLLGVRNVFAALFTCKFEYSKTSALSVHVAKQNLLVFDIYIYGMHWTNTCYIVEQNYIWTTGYQSVFS